jgi:16S rRNA (cytidine1402-2'-O)-methyltransferase
MSQPREPGTLWVVATPIGNLEDLSPRARHVLETAPLIAVEDTRVSSRLLAGREAPVELVSLHEHNEAKMAQRLIARLAEGIDIALVSDAGTPLVSDPGYRLVVAAHEAGIPVRSVPGPCAAIAALSVAGLPSDRFLFEGFLPPKPGARRRRLAELAAEPASVIVYVPARDLPVLFDDLAATFGADRLAALARELTKLHETVRRDTVAALAEWTRDDPQQQRGEAVVVIAGRSEPSPAVDADRLAEALAEELPPSRAAKLLARLTGLDRKAAWARLESIRAGDDED